MSYKIEITETVSKDGLSEANHHKIYEQVMDDIDLRTIIAAVNRVRARRPTTGIGEPGGLQAKEKGGAKAKL